MKSTTSPWQGWLQTRTSDIALIHGQNSYTWQELESAVAQYCQQLRAHHVPIGSVVVLIGKSQLELVFAYLACLKLAITPALTQPQPIRRLQDKVDTLYAPTSCVYIWDIASSLNPQHTPHQWQFIGVDNAASTDVIDRRDCHINGTSCLDNRYSSDGQATVLVSYQPHNIASIIFTSGSTGRPKAVVHSAMQHIASAQGLLNSFSFEPDDMWLLSLPMFHVSGLAIIWRWLVVGATLKVGLGELSVDIEGASHASLVPTQLKRLLERLTRH